MVKSKITDGRIRPLFSATVLGKYDVKYFQCEDTGFIQTEDPFWLEEAYAAAISSLDVGYVSRNIHYADVCSRVIDRCFTQAKTFLDFGGGYGLFVRLMRDRGYSFLRYDRYCANVFAQHFEFLPHVTKQPSRFDLLTAFEVFEHLVEPREQIRSMFELSDTILFSTELLPREHYSSAEDWWYFVPETGQHISFYSRRSLDYLASSFGARVFSNGRDFHVLTTRDDLTDPFENVGAASSQSYFHRLLCRIRRSFEKPVAAPAQNARASLLPADFEFVKARIRESFHSSNRSLQSPSEDIQRTSD